MTDCSDCGKDSKKIVKTLCMKCYHRKWSRANPKRRSIIMKRWLKKNPNYIKEYTDKRRAEKTKHIMKRVFQE